jgi:hypothetical protein
VREIIEFFARRAREEQPDNEAYADTHSLFAQRSYNFLCLAYGSDKNKYRYLVDGGQLPQDRAEGCEEEYDQVAFSIGRLILPHSRASIRNSLRRAFDPSRKPR